MLVDIQTRGFALTEALKSHCERRLRFALGSGSSWLHSVSVRLADENGPRGGIDKRCTIRAALPGAPSIVIAQDETDIYVAINRAADRFARTLARRQQRRGREYRATPSLLDTETDTHPAHPV